MPRAPAHLLQISEAARRLGVTTRAIRFYEESRLVSSRRGALGERLYDEEALMRLEFVCAARGAGLTLRQARALLILGDNAGAEARDAQLATACLRKLDELDTQRSRILGLIASCEPRCLQPMRPALAG